MCTYKQTEKNTCWSHQLFTFLRRMRFSLMLDILFYSFPEKKPRFDIYAFMNRFARRQTSHLPSKKSIASGTSMLSRATEIFRDSQVDWIDRKRKKNIYSKFSGDQSLVRVYADCNIGCNMRTVV